MNNLCKALMVAVGSAVVYSVVTKVAEKICGQPTQDDIEDIAEEVMEEFEDDFDEEVAENVFCKIGKEIKKYMAAQTSAIKEKIGLCKEILNSAQNRLTLGIITVAIGGGLIASAYIKLPE